MAENGIERDERGRFINGWRGGPGRPSAGATVRDWLNIMHVWTRGEVQLVLTEAEATVAKLCAAQQWIKAADGKDTSFDRVFDRTEGKPEQSVVLRTDPAQIHTLERIVSRLESLNLPAEQWPQNALAYREQRAKQIESKVVDDGKP